MAEVCKDQGNKCMDGLPVLISFLVGAAVGVGIVLFTETMARESEGKDYGDADLFV